MCKLNIIAYMRKHDIMEFWISGRSIFYSWLEFDLKKGVIITEGAKRITAPQNFKDVHEQADLQNSGSW